MRTNLEDFRPWGFQLEPITCQGDNEHINWSDMKDKLIRLAAKNTECYASDVLYDIERIESALKNNAESGLWFFGFRENGVDHNEYIESHWPHELKSVYRCIWTIELQSNPDDKQKKTMTMQRVEYHERRD